MSQHDNSDVLPCACSAVIGRRPERVLSAKQTEKFEQFLEQLRAWP